MPLYVVHQCPTVEEWMEYDANVVLSLPGIYKKDTVLLRIVLI